MKLEDFLQNIKNAADGSPYTPDRIVCHVTYLYEGLGVIHENNSIGTIEFVRDDIGGTTLTPVVPEEKQ